MRGHKVWYALFLCSKKIGNLKEDPYIYSEGEVDTSMRVMALRIKAFANKNFYFRKKQRKRLLILMLIKFAIILIMFKREPWFIMKKGALLSSRDFKSSMVDYHSTAYFYHLEKKICRISLFSW